MLLGCCKSRRWRTYREGAEAVQAGMRTRRNPQGMEKASILREACNTAKKQEESGGKTPAQEDQKIAEQKDVLTLPLSSVNPLSR
jgi:hypothetical protein